MIDTNILPADFDGVFRFTNASEEEFRAKWDGIEYTFPPLKTVPMIIPGATPEQVQSIRKKFAKEWALKEFGKTDKYGRLNEHVPGGVPAPYTDSDLAPFIQKCLEPLPLAQAILKKVPKDPEANLRRDAKGRLVTRGLDKDDSLKKDSSEMEE